MDAKQIFHENELQLFNFQDFEEGFFDVIFEISGNKLYAHKFRLAAISTTFQSMLSKRWNTKNEPIKIERHSYNDFKKFLTFIYSGECNLTDENIFAMIDIAEFYQVVVLKNICEEYLCKTEYFHENAFQMLELANRYSMVQLKQTFCTYMVTNLHDIQSTEKFLSLDNMIIKEIILFAEDKIAPEDVFEAIFKWAEHRADLKKVESNDVNFNLNEEIKNELSDLLPHIQFRKMKLYFLHNFVVLKAFIFPSLKELSDILSLFTTTTVKVTSPNGEILKGTLPSDDSAVEYIKSARNIPSKTDPGFINYFYWSIKCQVPSTPSRLRKKEEVEWYLIYFSCGYFGIKHRSECHEKNYLLAEMYSEGNLTISNGWRIEIV